MSSPQPKAAPGQVQQDVLNFLREHSGVVCRIDEIAAATGHNPGSVSSAVTALTGRRVRVSKPGYGLAVYGQRSAVGPGPDETDEDDHVLVPDWAVTDEAADSLPTIMEVIGRTMKGRVVLRDENGFIWQANRM
jgi:hypothetical protein